MYHYNGDRPYINNCPDPTGKCCNYRRYDPGDNSVFFTKLFYKTESVKPFYLTALIVVLVIVIALNASDIIDWIRSLLQSRVS